MKLRYIALSAEDPYYSGYDAELVGNLRYYTRFIENYLSKAVRKIKIELDETKFIHVALSKKSANCGIKDPAMNIRKVTLYCEEAELKQIVTLPDETERYEHYLSFLEKGYRCSNLFDEGQISQLLRLHQEFREKSYRNEWLFKKKPIREYGIYIYLKCYFTTYEFRLELEVFDLKQTRMLAKGTVMKTSPIEFCYEKDFRNLSIDNGYLTVLDFLDHPNFIFDLTRLAAGDFHLYYAEPEEWNKRNIGYSLDIDRLKNYPHL